MTTKEFTDSLNKIKSLTVERSLSTQEYMIEIKTAGILGAVIIPDSEISEEASRIIDEIESLIEKEKDNVRGHLAFSRDQLNRDMGSIYGSEVTTSMEAGNISFSTTLRNLEYASDGLKSLRGA